MPVASIPGFNLLDTQAATVTLHDREPYLFNFSFESERAMKNSVWQFTAVSQTQQAMSGGPTRICQCQKSEQNAKRGTDTMSH